MSSTHTNIAARAARWSAVHRKKAIFGWLAFVIIAFMVGNNVVGQTTISTVDGFNGESHDAEEAADAAGLRPNAEIVLIQSDELTIEDPAFTTAIEDVTGRLAAVKYVENVESPLDDGGSVSEDGRRPWWNSRSPATRPKQGTVWTRPSRRWPPFKRTIQT